MKPSQLFFGAAAVTASYAGWLWMHGRRAASTPQATPNTPPQITPTLQSALASVQPFNGPQMHAEPGLQRGTPEGLQSRLPAGALT